MDGLHLNPDGVELVMQKLRDHGLIEGSAR